MATRSRIRFVFRGKIHEIDDVPPTRTVLEYLRESRHLTGTKEGCAEGDCGACSVVIGTLEGDRLRYKAVNACIQFLPTLDGRQLLSVEDLRDPAGHLHPVQQEMIRLHGSQCGFCTPGFIMSMFALWHDDPGASRSQIKDALAGNLCRCTGYGPIVSAMESALEQRDYNLREAETIALLKQIRPVSQLELQGSGGVFVAPTTLEELADARARYRDATILAGGTDVGLWVTKKHRKLPALIYTGNIAALRRVEETDSAFSIGAAVTYSELPQSLTDAYPDFGEVLRRIGSRQVRNLGTVGGNIANGSPIGDTPPLLIVMGAELVLTGAGGSRRMPLEDFFLAYGKQDLRAGEFVERIVVPKPAPDQKFFAYKISKRLDQDISALCGAFNLTLADGRVTAVRIAFGGMAATPKRALKTEAALTGKPWTAAAIEAGCAAMRQDFTPISDMRASAAFRETAAANLLRKVFAETRPMAPETRIAAYGGRRGM